DLLPIRTDELVNEVRPRMPELPQEKRARFIKQYGISAYDAGVLANDLELASYFEKAGRGARNPKNVANWILNDLQNALTNVGLTIAAGPIAPEALDEL